MRTFDSGSVRDTDEGKADYFGFTSALVTKRFGEYMLKHQKQSDGSMRGSANWKAGIPQIEYVKSLNRHVVDVNLHLEGYQDEARESLEDAICAVIFNANGLLYELLKK
jgi:hypothetical protein